MNITATTYRVLYVHQIISNNPHKIAMGYQFHDRFTHNKEFSQVS